MDAQAWIAFAGVMVLLFIQTAAIAYWMGGQASKSRSNSARIEVLEDAKDHHGERSMEVVATLATLTEKVSNLTDQVRHMDALLLSANRQLSSLVTRRKGVVPPMADTLTDY